MLPGSAFIGFRWLRFFYLLSRRYARKIINMGRQITRIQRALRKMEGLLKQASAQKSRAGQVEVERLLTTALSYIETIKKSEKNHKREADGAIIKAFYMYQKLQRLAAEPDFFVGTDHNSPNRVVSSNREPGNREDRARYSAVRWDAAAMMAVPKDHAEWNPYWRPPKQAAPCYTYTKEELDELDPNRKKKCQK